MLITHNKIGNFTSAEEARAYQKAMAIKRNAEELGKEFIDFDNDKVDLKGKEGDVFIDQKKSVLTKKDIVDYHETFGTRLWGKASYDPASKDLKEVNVSKKQGPYIHAPIDNTKINSKDGDIVYQYNKDKATFLENGDILLQLSGPGPLSTAISGIANKILSKILLIDLIDGCKKKKTQIKPEDLGNFQDGDQKKAYDEAQDLKNRVNEMAEKIIEGDNGENDLNIARGSVAIDDRAYRKNTYGEEKDLAFVEYKQDGISKYEHGAFSIEKKGDETIFEERNIGEPYTFFNYKRAIFNDKTGDITYITNSYPTGGGGDW